ncbi:MAG: cell division FtsA domain-containing protein [bacterium]
MKQQTSIGIDIGTTLTRVVVCDGTQVLGIGTADTRGMRQGYIVDKDIAIESTRKAFTNAQIQSNTKIKEVVLAIGGIGLSSEYALGNSVVSRADGIISSFDIEKAISEAETHLDLKNKTILHAFPIKFKIDGNYLEGRPEGITGLKIEVKVFFVLCFTQHLQDMIDVVEATGVKVTNYIASPLAPSHSLLTDLQRNLGCALIDIGAETVSIALFENNLPAALHVFNIGALAITKDIALGLRISPEEAESMKLGVLSFQAIPKRKLDEIIDARITDIFEIIEKYLKKLGRSGLLPAGAVIIGGGSYMQTVDTIAKNMLKLPIRIGSIDLATKKGPTKDQQILIAYGAAQSTLQNAANKNKKNKDSDGILQAIKDFFKQLMP